MTEVLNPGLVCEDCGDEWTDENEWVMDVYRCDQQQEFCLNCCGCEEHETFFTEPWYEPKEKN